MVDWIKINLESRTDQSTPFKSNPNLKKTDELNSIREEVKELKDSIAEEKKEIFNIKGSIISIGAKLDDTTGLPTKDATSTTTVEL